MKTENLNFTLNWQSKRKNFIEGLDESNFKFPFYNIIIKNTEDLIINEFNNLSNHIPEMESILHGNHDGYVCPKLIIRPSNSVCSTEFKYNFENNYKRYKELNNKIGFYKNLNIKIDYHENDSEDFLVNVQYKEIEDIEKNKLFQKVYRSTDYFSVKLFLDKEYIKEKQIHSLLIISEASNREFKNKKLKNLFIENIEDKYLDINDKYVSLTVPFIESNIVEFTENINIKIVCLNSPQSDMYNFLNSRENQENINIFLEEFFPNQFFDIGKIYKQNTNNEMILYYQNYLYLFNQESLNSNSEQSDRVIGETKFNKYFPLLNKDQNNRTICLSDDLNTDNIRDNNFDLSLGYLGYYGKNINEIEDVAIDLDYFQQKNVLSAKILEIEENQDQCSLYMEFITNLYSNERLFIESNQNLKYIEKYKTLIEDKEYITLLFKYTYSLENTNQYLTENSSTLKNQIIADKDLINFSAKLIL